MRSAVAATILGAIATVCWCIQLIPQIFSNWKQKDCTGFPPLMMLLWIIGNIPIGILFCISRATLILQIQPHLLIFFCFIAFFQACFYPPVSIKRWKIGLILFLMAAFTIGLEIGFVLLLRPLYDRGSKWPNLLFGILAIVFVGIGFLPVYLELAKRQGRAIGINLLFLFLDSLGAWLSIISVALSNMDIMGLILYSEIALIEIGIFLSHFIWCYRFKWGAKKTGL